MFVRRGRRPKNTTGKPWTWRERRGPPKEPRGNTWKSLILPKPLNLPFGDFLGFNPQWHALVTDGCFYGKGMFRVAPLLDLKKLEAIFRQKVFKRILV